MRLKGKSVVITGASAGMGRTMVSMFVQEGAKVVAVARRQDALEELREELAGTPGRIEIYPGDCSKQEVCNGMIDFAVEQFGKLDVLVNNAGIMDDMGAIGELNEELMMKVFSLNTFGVMYAMKKAVNVFLAQGRPDPDTPVGSIINITSIGAQHPCAGAAYCATKAAIEHVTRHTAFNYLWDGIRCNAIAPGGIMTDMALNMPASTEFGGANVQRLTPLMPGMGEPETIANAAIYLASDESAYVNGQILGVNGGWMVV